MKCIITNMNIASEIQTVHMNGNITFYDHISTWM